MTVSAGSRPGADLVSVVIAAYNAEKYIADTLRSVLSQSHAAVEVIVVDDGSRDATCQVVSSFGDQVRLIRIDNSGGPAKPRNIGAASARGDYLVFFDADDLMLPDRLTVQLETLMSCPGAQAVVSDYRNFSEQGDYAQTHFESCVNLRQITGNFQRRELRGPEVQDALLIENFCITSTCMFRRSAFESAGGFDAELFVGEDFELLYRLARSGSIAVDARLACRRRLHDANVSNRLEYNLRQKIRTRMKLLDLEQDGQRTEVLRRRLGELHAGLFQLLSRESPLAALNHLKMAVGFGTPIFQWETLKGLLKVLLTSASFWRRKPRPGNCPPVAG